mmetsp:Transcript_16655/g.38236  ORF Transcript_16655/g.38236 Transcript_16655/m.38236 type:complete len:269 (+) Transcript_16655:122-928(+)
MRVGHALVLALVVAALLGLAVVVDVRPLLQAHPPHLLPGLQKLVAQQGGLEAGLGVRDLAPGPHIELSDVLGAPVPPGVGVERQVGILGRLFELGQGFLRRRPGVGGGHGAHAAPHLGPAADSVGFSRAQGPGQVLGVGRVGIRPQELRGGSSRSAAVGQLEELLAGLLGLAEVLNGRLREGGVGRDFLRVKGPDEAVQFVVLGEGNVLAGDHREGCPGPDRLTLVALDVARDPEPGPADLDGLSPPDLGEGVGIGLDVVDRAGGDRG